MKQNLSKKDNAIKIADVIAMLPTKEEVEKEASRFDNSMSSMEESFWMPEGFKKGVEWVLEKLEEGLGPIEIKEEEVITESVFSSLVEEKDLIGDLEDFPIEVVRWLVEEQVRQGNSVDVSVFQEDVDVDYNGGGIDWDDCPEEEGFCIDILMYKRFDVFFDKYPKQEEEEPKHEKTIYDLDLHESLYLPNLSMDVVRVPGGWIYSHWCNASDKALGGVFVKYDNEFQNQ